MTTELRNMVDGKTGLTHREGSLRNLNHPHRPRSNADIEIFLNGYWVRAITENTDLSNDPDFDMMESILLADDNRETANKNRLESLLQRVFQATAHLESVLPRLTAHLEDQSKNSFGIDETHRHAILRRFGAELYAKLDEPRAKTNLWIVTSDAVLRATGLDNLAHQETPFSATTLFGLNVALCDCNTLRLVWAFDKQRAVQAVNEDFQKNVNVLRDPLDVHLRLPIKDD